MSSDQSQSRHGTRSRASAVLLAAALGAATASCGGSSSPTEPTTSAGGGSAPAGITLTSGGVSVHALKVAPGTMVTFTNADNVAHEMASDPHPIHTQCPELNGPVLQPGASFTAHMASNPETCGFHDHLNATNAAFKGTITVSN